MRGFFDPRQLIHAPATELHNGGFVPYAETPSRAATIAAALPALERPADHGEAAILGQAAALYLFFYYLGSSLLGSAGGFAWTHAGWPGVAAFCALLSIVALIVSARLGRVPALALPERRPERPMGSD